MQHLQCLKNAIMADKVVKILQNFTLFHQYNHVNQPLRIQTHGIENYIRLPLKNKKQSIQTSFSSTLMVN